MKKNLLAIFEEQDEKFVAGLIGSGLKSTCERGCNHCCRQMTMITYSEGKAIVDALGDSWRSMVDDITAAAILCGDGTDVNVDSYWMAQVTCPLLTKDGDCSVYAARPACCRYLVSFEHPWRCSFNATLQGKGDNLMVSDTRPFQEPVLNFGMDEAWREVGARLYVAPIAVVVLHILKLRHGVDTLTVPDPEIWAKRFFTEKLKEQEDDRRPGKGSQGLRGQVRR